MIFSPSFFQWHSTPSGSPRHYLTAHTHTHTQVILQQVSSESLWDHRKRSSSSGAHSNACLYLPQMPAPLDPRSSRSAAAPERSHYCSYWEPRLAQHLSDERKTFSESSRPVHRKETTKSIINNLTPHLQSGRGRSHRTISVSRSVRTTPRLTEEKTFVPFPSSSQKFLLGTSPFLSACRTPLLSHLEEEKGRKHSYRFHVFSSTSTEREAWQLKLFPKNM